MKKNTIILGLVITTLVAAGATTAFNSAKDFLSGVGDTEFEISYETESPVTDMNSAPVEEPVSEISDALFALNLGEYEKDGTYSVEEFGDWVDTNGNGCDTRNDILARDLVDTVIDSNCKVMGGVLTDIYTDKTIDFVYGQGACTESQPGVTIQYDPEQVGGCSNAVPVEHVISRENAWYAGARYWTADERVAFSNDMDNLTASINLLNSVKGGKTPAELLANSLTYEDGIYYVTTKAGVAYDMPFNNCYYSETYGNVAQKYSLTVNQADYDALITLNKGC